jgi:hypothetical protein
MSEADDQPQPPPPGQPPPESEEELRARIEEQLRTVRVQDLLLESVVSVLNLAARRIAKEDERDLEQARLGIEATRALVDLLDPEQANQVRAGLSQVQMLYARVAEGREAVPAEGEEPGGAEPQAPAAERPQPGGGRRPPPKLWTPPGT